MKQAISNIQWGLLFILWNVNLGRLNILPDFAGYLCFISALDALQEEYPDISRLRPFCRILRTVSLASWIISIFVTFDIPLLSLFMTIFEIYVIYTLLSLAAGQACLQELEAGTRLRRLKNGLSIFQVVIFAFLIYLENSNMLTWGVWLIYFWIFVSIELRLSEIKDVLSEENV